MIRYQTLRSLRPPLDRRSIALLSQTPPHRSPWLGVNPQRSLRHATSVTVQRVRFKRPPIFTKRRFVTWIAYTIPVVALLWWQPIGIEWVEEEEQDAEEQEEEDDEELDPDHVSFIPVGWPKKLPQEYYKGTDPEWQAFKTFSQDKKRPIAVQKQLVGELRTAVSRDPRMVHQIGKVNGKLGRAMLTIIFPSGPPRLYAVSGIALTDTEIGLATKIMSQAEYLRLRNAIYPTAAFEGIKNSSKYLFYKQWNALKQTFGFTDSNVFPTNVNPQHQRQAEQKGKTSDDGESPKIGPLPPVQAEASKRSTSEPHPEVSNGSTSTSKNSTKLPFWFPFPVSTSTEAKASIAEQEPKRKKPDAWNAFAKGFVKEYAKVVGAFEVPRGNIFVTGMVEVVGDKGRLTMDVVAAYDLTTGRVTEFKGYQRSFNPNKQSPLGK